MFEIPWHVYPVFGLVIGFVGMRLLLEARMHSHKREREELQLKLAMATPMTPSLLDNMFNDYPIPVPKGNWCRDCGQVMISTRRQHGFDAETGKPNYIYEKVCRDFNPANPVAMGPYCRNTKIESAMPNAHTHSDPTDMHADCPPCIDVMLQDRVIDDERATQLYQEAGMGRPLTEAAWRSSRWPITMQS